MSTHWTARGFLQKKSLNFFSAGANEMTHALLSLSYFSVYIPSAVLSFKTNHRILSIVPYDYVKS